MATSGDQSAGGGSAARASKLRYPLRSASRGKAAPAPAAADAPAVGSAPRRVKPSSDVSKSMCVVDVSLKDKSAKPPRRHSIPTKPGASPRPTPSGTVTPVSGVRSRRFDTPTSEVSMSTARRKFSTLSSMSYWMTQIRLAEAASKHSVSLGFFKLALESECEPVDRMREELKSYVARHGLATELEEPVKDILQVFDIVEDFEKLKISADPSQQPKKSDKAARTATNVSPNGNLKPRSLNSDATQNKEAAKKENIQKLKPDARVRGSYNKNAAKDTTAKGVAKNTGKKAKKQPQGQQEVGNEDREALADSPDEEPADVVKDKENMGDTEMSVDTGIAQEI
ncbi:hypothetical protein ACP70R_043278 [Stipagrostis hirtigluma subsp. patula]